MKNVFLIFILIVNIITLSAEDNAAVEVTTYPAVPVINSSWTISLIVDYPFPDDVSVIEPEFPFTLDRIVKYSKTKDAKIKTVFEYSFIPSEGGSFKIGAFTVMYPDGITKTDTINLDIRPLNEKRTLPVLRLFWDIKHDKISSLSEVNLFQMTEGERALLVMRLNRLNSQPVLEYPPQEFFAPVAPQGAILALSPLSTEERAAGIMLKLTLIPLKGDFRLDARTLQNENFIFEIPPLYIRVNKHVEKAEETAHIADMVKAGNINDTFQEEPQYSEIPANVNINKISAYNTLRRFYFVLIYSVIFLVILTPIVCFLLLKNGKK
jgi:hypothetical protein